jgi:hypothetical protein
LQKAYHSDGQVGKLCVLTPPKTVIGYRIMTRLEANIRGVLRDLRSRETTALELAGRAGDRKDDAQVYRAKADAYKTAVDALERVLNSGS